MLNNISSNYPWQKWPHRQYLLSQTRARLSLAERGAFADLKDIAATQTPFGSVPNDDNAIAGWLMISLKQWLKIKTQVLADWLLDGGRYFLPLLINNASDQEERTIPAIEQPNIKATQPTQNKTKEISPELSAVRAEAARLSHQKRRDNNKQKLQNDLQNSNLQIANDLQTCNLQIAKPVQNGGIKGGDLDLEQDLDKNFVVVNQTIANKQSAHEIANLATQQQTTKFFMHFDFKVEPSELEPFLIKLDVPMTKHSSHALGNFVAHYVPKNFKNTRDEWIYQYAKWLQREKETPVDKSVDNSSPKPTKLAAAFIQPVKPLWETMADKKAQQQAQQPKAESALAASALAQIKKSVGLKEA